MRNSSSLGADPYAARLVGNDGGDIIILTGEARVDDAAPASSAIPAYQSKYHNAIVNGLKMTAESFAESYSVPIRFIPAKVRGH